MWGGTTGEGRGGVFIAAEGKKRGGFSLWVAPGGCVGVIRCGWAGGFGVEWWFGCKGGRFILLSEGGED